MQTYDKSHGMHSIMPLRFISANKISVTLVETILKNITDTCILILRHNTLCFTTSYSYFGGIM